MFEEQMGDPIISFVQREGYSVFPQIPLFIGKIDFVGINEDAECLVIESKVKDWRKALKQALRYGYGAEKTYIALPTPTARNVARKYREMFENYDVGLIEISKEVNILIPCRNKDPSPVFKRIILGEVEKRIAKSRERIVKFKERFEK